MIVDGWNYDMSAAPRSMNDVIVVMVKDRATAWTRYSLASTVVAVCWDAAEDADYGPGWTTGGCGRFEDHVFACWRALPEAAPGDYAGDPPERAKLAALIKSSLLGVKPDDQDLVLEDVDWRTILAALEGVERVAEQAFNEGWRTREARPGQVINSRGLMRSAWLDSNARGDILEGLEPD